jgi:hypothetical protein
MTRRLYEVSIKYLYKGMDVCVDSPIWDSDFKRNQPYEVKEVTLDPCGIYATLMNDEGRLCDVEINSLYAYCTAQR